MNESKIERQLNLFFLLLNSNRPITRQEIKNKILDYKNNESEKAFERMFERDKDDLRKNGISIKTINLNSLFEDEVGYLLDKEAFLTKNINFNEEEKIILRFALSMWNDNEISSSAENIFKKMGVSNINFDELLNFKLSSKLFDLQQKILKAIISKNEISILYISAHQDAPQWRYLQPIKVLNKSRDLLLVAFDTKDKKLKSFKITNIIDFQLSNKTFGKIQEIDLSFEPLNIVKLKISNNLDYYVNLLGGKKIDLDMIEIPVFNYVATARFLLPYIHIVEEILDKDLKEAVISELKNIYEAVNG